MTYNPARALTASELAALRADGQFSILSMVIVPQQTVLACQCAATASNNDAVTSIPITAITAGSVANVRNGMTCYVGSGSGLDDLGMVRVKAASGSTLTIARVSGITWTPNVYLTVVDDFGIWAKLPVLDTSGTTTAVMMDDNVEYTNQNLYTAPVPIMGCDTAVPLTSGSLGIDATNSYSPDGSAITNYQWSVYNGGSISGSISTAGSSGSGLGIATFAFPGAGSYNIQLTITTANGAQTTGHRSVYVYNTSTFAPLTQFSVQKLEGDRDDGGWEAEVTMWEECALPTVRDRAKVILIANDYYGGSALSIGQMAGSERVVMVGWIAAESIRYTREFSTVKFSVKGAHHWLKQATGPSTFLESVVDTPTVWTSIQNLTLDKVIWHFLRWRSTACEVIDVYRCNNTRIIGGMSASIGSIWEQIYDTALTRMLTYIACDRYSRFFAFTDPQVLSATDRLSIPAVQAVTDNDLGEEVNIQRTIVDPVALLEVAGLATTGTDVLMYMSRAPGSLIYNRWGANDQNDRLVVSNQADANALAGMLLAKKNNEYGSIALTMAQANHMLDIAPAMYITYTVSGSANARNISFTTKNLLIRNIGYEITPDTGEVKVTMDTEGETSGIPGYTVIMPQEPVYAFPNLPDLPEFNITPINWSGYLLPYQSPLQYLPSLYGLSGSACRSGSGVQSNGIYLPIGEEVWSTDKDGVIVPCPNLFVRGVSGSSGSGISGSIISGSAFSGSGAVYTPSWLDTNRTRYQITGDWTTFTIPSLGVDTVYPSGSVVYNSTNTDNWYDVLALDASGSVVAVGVHDQVTMPNIRSGTFYVSGSGNDIAAIQIVCKTWEHVTVQSDATLTNASNGGVCGDVGAGRSESYDSTTEDHAILITGTYETNNMAIYPGIYDAASTLYFNQLWALGSSYGKLWHIVFTCDQGGQYRDYVDPDACIRTGMGASGAAAIVNGLASEDYDIYITPSLWGAPTSMAGLALSHRVWAHGGWGGPTIPLWIRGNFSCRFEPVPTYKIILNSILLYNVCAGTQSGVA